MKLQTCPDEGSIPSRHGVASTRLLRDALELIDCGIAVVPVHGKCPVMKYAGLPAIKPEVIRETLSDPTVTGLAVRAGSISGGLAVGDFDSIAAHQQWADQNKTLARELPTVRTPRGAHVLCRSDLERIVHIHRVGEFRGAGISISPHSLHPSGKLYEWINPLNAITRLPEVSHEVFTGKIDRFKRKMNYNAIFPSEGLPVLLLYSVERLIQETRPTQRGERVHCIWHFARGLKFNCGIRQARVEELEGIVRRWHQAAVSVIGTKNFRATWRDFLCAYENASVPLGANWLDQAAAMVDPEDLPQVAYEYKKMQMRQLIALCASLATLNQNDGYFHLSGYVAAERIQKSQPTIWRMMQSLIHDGVLECVDRGKPGTGPSRRAAVYRWRADVA